MLSEMLLKMPAVFARVTSPERSVPCVAGASLQKPRERETVCDVRMRVPSWETCAFSRCLSTGTENILRSESADFVSATESLHPINGHLMRNARRSSKPFAFWKEGRHKKKKKEEEKHMVLTNPPCEWPSEWKKRGFDQTDSFVWSPSSFDQDDIIKWKRRHLPRRSTLGTFIASNTITEDKERVRTMHREPSFVIPNKKWKKLSNLSWQKHRVQVPSSQCSSCHRHRGLRRPAHNRTGRHSSFSFESGFHGKPN